MGEHADDYYRNEVKRKFNFDPGSMYKTTPVKKRCPKCGKYFKTDQSVKDHLRDYHGEPNKELAKLKYEEKWKVLNEQKTQAIANGDLKEAKRIKQLSKLSETYIDRKEPTILLEGTYEISQSLTEKIDNFNPEQKTQAFAILKRLSNPSK